ncbi:hypothetical protein QFC22_006253 [Naganishia vaughanmartiniae]|uniref:Uncharacterized protein n=1 Tax=Naganishia vaughanmartiniae TaxID=1424756 RepID=A0ACC2WM44_9TREE|nr:hypothetical protein QFC22_006253 [Naganishia vaughanmartiniae]
MPAFQAAYRHPDVLARLQRNGWNPDILADTFTDKDDENPYKLMAVIEMLTGLKTNLLKKKEFANEEAMRLEEALGERVTNPSTAASEDVRTVQAPLFAFGTDGGLRPLWVKEKGIYIVKDCRALNDSVVEEEKVDPQGLNVQWGVKKVYASSEWFVRMDPGQDLFAFANSASARVILEKAGQAKLFDEYWAE